MKKIDRSARGTAHSRPRRDAGNKDKTGAARAETGNPGTLLSGPAPAALALGLLTALSYLPATRAGFVWDDVIITTLPAIQEWGGLWRLWFDPGGAYLHDDVGEGHYWPLTYSTFWLEHKLWGFAAPGYHVVNLLLHIANALLLWRLLQRLEIPAPWLVAALFAVHPLAAEPVTWVIGRKDLLSTLCYLGAITAWLNFAGASRRRHYLLSLALYVAGLLCKSSVVTLPGALLLLHWWKEGRIELRVLLRLVPFFVAGSAIVLADLSFYQGREPLSLGYTVSERVLIAGQALWFYIGKLLWPTNLAVVYPHWEVNVSDPLAWVYVLAACAVPVVFWRVRHRFGRGPLACVVFFAMTLAPVLGFINYGYMQFSFVADRYQYLAGIGMITLFAGAGVYCFNKLPARAQKFRVWVVLALLPALATLTWQHSGIYRDELTFFNHIIALNPDARRVYHNLAATLNDLGRTEEALAAARIAVEKSPDSAETRTTLGLALLKLEHYDEAEESLQYALEINPRHAAAWQNLADLRRRQGQYEAALELFHKALEINPDAALIHAGIGYCQFRLDRYQETVSSIRRALFLQPDLAHTHRDLYLFMGWALHELGRVEESDKYLAHILGKEARETDDYLQLADGFRVKKDYEKAVELYRRALEMEPGLAAAYAGMGDGLYRLKRYEDAIKSMQQALALKPDLPSAPALYYLTGEALLTLEKPEQAAQHYENALQVKPEFDEAANRLAEVRFAQKRYQEALELYQGLAAKNPDDASTHSNMGAVLFLLGRPEQALQKFEQALSLDPTLETALANREQVRMSLQQGG